MVTFLCRTFHKMFVKWHHFCAGIFTKCLPIDSGRRCKQRWQIGQTELGIENWKLRIEHWKLPNFTNYIIFVNITTLAVSNSRNNQDDTFILSTRPASLRCSLKFWGLNIFELMIEILYPIFMQRTEVTKNDDSLILVKFWHFFKGGSVRRKYKSDKECAGVELPSGGHFQRRVSNQKYTNNTGPEW